MGVSSTKIAYIACEKDEKGAYTGAVLVTDARGMPLDFRYTDPVKPTRIQEILYGHALQNHLIHDVIIATLLTVLEVKPGLYICQRALLEGGMDKFFALERTEIPPLDSIGASRAGSAEDELFIQLLEMSPPHRLIAPDKDDRGKKVILEALKDISRTMDPAEPIERVERAIQEIASSGKKDS